MRFLLRPEVYFKQRPILLSSGSSGSGWGDESTASVGPCVEVVTLAPMSLRKGCIRQPPAERPRLERGHRPMLPARGQEDLHQPGSGSGPPLGMSRATQCPMGMAREHRVAPAFWLR